METITQGKIKVQHSEVYRFHKELDVENGVLKFYIGLYKPCKTEECYVRSEEYLIQVYKTNFWGELEWHGTIHASEQECNYLATLVLTKRCLTIESVIRVVKDNVYETQSTHQDNRI